MTAIDPADGPNGGAGRDAATSGAVGRSASPVNSPELHDRLLIRPYGGAPFTLQGFVGERQVMAETVEANLVVDEVLYERARGLVARGARFDLPDYGRSFGAAVDGDGAAVALTFLRSFDRVVSMRMSLDPG